MLMRNRDKIKRTLLGIAFVIILYRIVKSGALGNIARRIWSSRLIQWLMLILFNFRPGGTA